MATTTPNNNAKTPKPPKTLSKSSKEYFTRFCDEYETDDSIIAVLTKVCESLDRAAEAAAGLKANGSLTTLDRFGCVKCHPLVLVERAASAAAINGIKALGVLKNEPEPEDKYARKVF
jgi:phage terminase small subunit